jgi:hypothetical protein
MKKNTMFKIRILFAGIMSIAMLSSCETDQQKFVREREAKERTIGEPIKQLVVKIGEYSDLKFPIKIQEKPKLKPKFAIIHNYKAAADYTTVTIYPQFDGFDYPNDDLIQLIEADTARFAKKASIFGFSESELAQTHSEIATTIKVECGNGNLLSESKITTRNKSGRQTSSSTKSNYETVCKVSILDMTEKSLIAEKTFPDDAKDENNKEESQTNNNQTGKIPKQLSEYISEYLGDLKKT